MNRLFIDHSIGEIIEKTQSGELAPSAPSDAALENIKELDPSYHAWVASTDREAAASLNPSGGLLPGIPVGVKDIFNTEEFPTQMGSPLWKDFTPGNDARAVFNLKREGAIVVGKTVTAEFAVHALNETLNPYDALRTPGTSSSGSAVAVSLGMVPLTTGTQTAGSIIRPASFCDVYGMKPSFGFIPRTGMLKTTDSLDTIGFFTRHAADLRRAFDSMRVAGKDYPISNAAISDSSRQEKPHDKPWRVGIAHTHTYAQAPQYAKDTLEAFASRLASLSDMEVSEATLPDVMKSTHETHASIYGKALSYYFENEYQEKDSLSPVMKELIETGRTISPEEYKNALARQTEIIYAMDQYFGESDILLSLSTAGEAPLREVVETPDASLMWTLAHLPTVNLPVGTSPSGLPFGIQAVARKYNDYLLLSFVEQLVEKGLIPKQAGYFV